MATVHAITEDGKRFVMFRTLREDFAHSNAKATSHLYTEKIVAYEWQGTVYPLDGRLEDCS